LFPLLKVRRWFHHVGIRVVVSTGYPLVVLSAQWSTEPAALVSASDVVPFGRPSLTERASLA